jgi:multisubunit Na+/H+ antiporter MnhE subunit
VRRVWAVGRLLAVGAWEVARSNLRLAGWVLDPLRGNRPGFVQVPLRVRGDVAITVLSNWITLTPGTIAVDVAPDRSHLLVHVFDLQDEAAAVAEIRQRLEAAVAEVFE